MLLHINIPRDFFTLAKFTKNNNRYGQTYFFKKMIVLVYVSRQFLLCPPPYLWNPEVVIIMRGVASILHPPYAINSDEEFVDAVKTTLTLMKI